MPYYCDGMGSGGLINMKGTVIQYSRAIVWGTRLTPGICGHDIRGGKASDNPRLHVPLQSKQNGAAALIRPD